MEGVESATFPAGIFLFVLVCCGFFGFVYVSVFKNKPDARKKDTTAASSSHRRSSDSKSAHSKVAPKQAQQPVTNTKLHKKVPFRSIKHQFSCPDLIGTFKGHTEPITSGAVSANGKGLVTSARDRTVFFYNLREAFCGNATGGFQGSRTNIKFDHVDRLCWSPDYCAVVVHKADAQTIEVLKGAKKSDGTLGNLEKVREFPKHFPERLVGLSVANNGKFIMTCDTTNQLRMWDLRGEHLAAVDTRQGHTLHATVSIDDRFVATSGFTPDVKVFEVVYDKSGNFKDLVRAFELTGHNSRVFCSHFSPDSSKMVTVSKDGTWNLYDTSIDYKQGQLPHLKLSGPVPEARNASDEAPCVVRLSPDGRVVLVAVASSVYCHSASNGALVHTINDIYAGPILDVFFDAGNQFFVTLGDLHAHLFHNVAGHHAVIQDLEVSLKAANYSGLKERIKSQLDAARQTLKKLEDRSNSGEAGDHISKKKK